MTDHENTRAPARLQGVRVAISKGRRFEIFKRDGFACQYCGATPPAVVLEVDHIEAVSKGGANDDGNLITACFECNRGKGARALTVAPESLSDKAVRIAESEAQLAAYRVVMREAEERIEADAWEVIDALFGANETTKARFASVQTFLKKLDLFEVKEAAELARSRQQWESARFKYFCGICWNKIKDASQ